MWLSCHATALGACYAPKQSKIRVSNMALLRVEKQNGIATVSLNRPEKRNAMSFALLN